MGDERLKTGVPGLDPIVGGGLIPDSLYLVKGAPGTGKTTVEKGSTYSVGIATHPRKQQCSVLEASGTANDDVTHVAVMCFERIAVDALAMARSVRLSWNQPPGTQYQLYWSTDPHCNIGAITDCQAGQTAEQVESPYTAVDLEDGQNYSFWLKAQRTGGHTTISQTGARPDQLITDGNLRALQVDESTGTVYMGGSFKALGARSGGGVPFRTDSVGTYPFPIVHGNVGAIAPDGEGGWYIGGNFTRVGEFARNNIAHILADGSVGPWDPNADDIVRALVVRGDIVYAGGSFDEIGGKYRQNLAALDRATGWATDWHPAPNHTVRTLALGSDTLYAGGNFTLLADDEPRKYAAAFDLLTGNPTDWAPDIGGLLVQALALSDNRLYVGGNFTGVDDEPRSHLAAFDLPGGTLANWAPSANHPVHSVFVDGNIVYAGGDFSEVDGETHQCIVAMDASTGVPTAWAPALDSTVMSIAVANGVVYAGGYFGTVDDVHVRPGVAAIDAESGKPTAWAPQLSGAAIALAFDNDVLYVGGPYRIAHGAQRDYLAALDKDGYLTDWNPGANNLVYSLTLTDNLLYVGGQFTTIANQPRERLAALNPTTGNTNSWNPNANGIVYSIVVSKDDEIYVGGQFSEIGNSERWRVARFAAGSSTPDTWAPSFNANKNSGAVQALVLYPESEAVYVGGIFQTVNDASCTYLTVVSTKFDGSGTPTWCSKLDGSIYALALSGSTLYAGGTFDAFIDEYEVVTPRVGIAAFNVAFAEAPLLPWNPGANNSVYTLLVRDDTLYVGGRFTSIGGQERHRIAALDIHGDAIDGWGPEIAGTGFTGVNAIAAHEDKIHVGGSFQTVAGEIANGFVTVEQ